MKKRFWLLLIFILAAAMSGCDGDKVAAAGMYSPVVTLDGAAVDAAPDLLYFDGRDYFLSAEGLAAILPDVLLEPTESGGLSVASGDAVCHFSSGDAAYGGGSMGVAAIFGRGQSESASDERPAFDGDGWYIPIQGLPWGFLCRAQVSADCARLALTGYDHGLSEAGEVAASAGGSLVFTGQRRYDRTYLRDSFPVYIDDSTYLYSRTGEALTGAISGWLRDEGDCYRLELDSGLVGRVSRSGETLLEPVYLDVKPVEGAPLLLLLGQNGKFGVASAGGKELYPCELDAVGGYMDAGFFVYPNGSEQGVLAGRLDEAVLLYGKDGFVARSGGLWGALSFDGGVLAPFVYDALFPAPLGDRPGWYGRSGSDYELLMPLPSRSAPVLSAAEQAALDGATLVLLQRQGVRCRVADIATGTAYALPRSVADSLFGTAPLFTLATVQLYGGELSPLGYPTPAYAISPVLTVSEGAGTDGTAISYPAALMARMQNAGGAIGLSDYRLNSVTVVEQGDAYFSLLLSCDAKPQTGASAWGEAGDDGWVHGLELELTLFVGVDESGNQMLCAVGRNDETWYASPFSSGLYAGPQPREGPYRYTPETREDVYSAMASGWVEERVFYEDESCTWIWARSLSERKYSTDIFRLDTQGQKQLICRLPESLGLPVVFGGSGDRLYVTTWKNLFASSGSAGPMGVLTEDGFEPLLEGASYLGSRGSRAYILGGRALYEFNTVNAALRELCHLPESYAVSLDPPRLQSITAEWLHIAWPVSHGLIPGYEVIRINTASGEAERVYP